MTPKEQNLSSQDSLPAIGDVTTSTTGLLTKALDDLKQNAGARADDAPRLFFPNGIELINVIVKVNLQSGVDVEIKIAGAKGIQGSTLEQSSLTPKEERGSPSITSVIPSAVKAGWEGTVRIFGSGFDSGSFVLFSGSVPKASVSATLIEAQITKEITGTSGTKDVIVHTSDGSESNTASFLVD